METKDVLTLALAAIGATLGVVNFLLDRWRNKTRLQVRVLYGLLDRQRDVLTIRLVNKSNFPLHIERIVASSNRRMSPSFEVIVFAWNRTALLPIELHPRASLTLIAAPVAANASDVKAVKWIGVATECGYEAFAKGPAISVLKEQASVTSRFEVFLHSLKSYKQLVVGDKSPPVKNTDES